MSLVLKPFTIVFISLFPDCFLPFLNHSIIKKALEKGIVVIKTINLADFGVGKHKKVDDYQFGPGRGMVLRPEPLYQAILAAQKLITGKSYKVLLSAAGKTFAQTQAFSFANSTEGLILISGNYEGVDERIVEYVDYELSVGNYVLTGGELPALIVANAVIRLLPGVIHTDSALHESFTQPMLDYPVYTQPRVFNGKSVPEILLSGHHEKI